MVQDCGMSITLCIITNLTSSVKCAAVAYLASNVQHLKVLWRWNWKIVFVFQDFLHTSLYVNVYKYIYTGRIFIFGENDDVTNEIIIFSYGHGQFCA